MRKLARVVGQRRDLIQVALFLLNREHAIFLCLDRAGLNHPHAVDVGARGPIAVNGDQRAGAVGDVLGFKRAIRQQHAERCIVLSQARSVIDVDRVVACTCNPSAKANACTDGVLNVDNVPRPHKNTGL